MRFRCSHCGFDHKLPEASFIAHPESGTLLGMPWFRDERGLNHQISVCLECGTIHATTGAPLKALFSFGSRLANVKFYIPPTKLQELIDEQGFAAVIEHMGLKKSVVEELVVRDFIHQ